MSLLETVSEFSINTGQQYGSPIIGQALMNIYLQAVRRMVWVMVNVERKSFWSGDTRRTTISSQKARMNALCARNKFEGSQHNHTVRWGGKDL